MTIQLLINEEMVKALLPIDKNVAGEYLSPAMFQAQEIGLKGILGSRLLAKLKEYEAAGTISQHSSYLELKEQCANYLIYQTIVEIIPMVSYKLANAGVIKSQDEKMVHASQAEVDAQIENYQGKADYFCYELQRWLLANHDSYPELTGCEINEIKSNLYSMSSCGIWLGGLRGYEL